MNIVELAKEVEKAYEEYRKHKNSYDCYKGLGSKAYAKRRIELLQDELLKMKEDIKNS